MHESQDIIIKNVYLVLYNAWMHLDFAKINGPEINLVGFKMILKNVVIIITLKKKSQTITT